MPTELEYLQELWDEAQKIKPTPVLILNDIATRIAEILGNKNQSQPSLPSVEEEEIAEKLARAIVFELVSDRKDASFAIFKPLFEKLILSALRQHRRWSGK